MYVDIGEIPQWLEIEQGPADAPIILLVHGGPGASTRFASVMWQTWREHFTLVHWDQRGAGRTFTRNGPERCIPMSFARIVADGIEVSEHLCRELCRRRLILLGHSWGAAVSIHMAKARPDLFTACVTTGLVVNFRENEAVNHARLLDLARAAGNREALEAIEGLGGPPYDTEQAVRIHREWADRFSDGTGDSPSPKLTAPPTNLTAEDREAGMRPFLFSVQHLFADLCAVDLPALGPRFDLPMFCFMGTHDQQTPFTPAEAYFAGIEAPLKAFIPIVGCHHFAHMNRPDAFLKLLLEHLKPLGPE
jgi:pimeloyl-ACP methyl ester carboxylesterase